MGCDNPVDVAFLVDSSGSLCRDGFRSQKEFIKAIAKEVNVSPLYSRIGVITYSGRASVEIKLSDYTQLESLIDAVELLPYLGKTTRIDKAIALASKKLMTAEGGRRKGVPGVLIVMTDGRQTPDADVTPIEEAASNLWKLELTTFVIGIGKMVDAKELIKLAMREDNLFLTPSVKEMSSLAQPLAMSICKAAGMVPR